MADTSQLSSLLKAKQYHQLTQLLLDISEKQPDRLPQLYPQFVHPMESNIHPLSLSILAQRTCLLKAPADALAFLSPLLLKFTPTEDDFKKWTCFKIQAFVYIKLLVIQQNQTLQQFELANNLLSEVELTMSRVLSFEPIVNAQYYKVKADVYQLKGEFESYYNTSFEYLKYATNLSKEELVSRGTNMSIAALLGNIYRFGELTSHEVFKHVDKWLSDLISAAEHGQLSQFEQLKPKIAQHVFHNNLECIELPYGCSYSKISLDDCIGNLVQIEFETSSILAIDATGQSSRSRNTTDEINGPRPFERKN
eukprot:NODE_180_length_13923_cov_0.697772.p6 type:complete len:309 gc:universal NODE_180_length_13923_cov_0.697772:6209-5283(-)